MGRWTPLVLMAGGLAILLGTLLGISFPMDGRNAQAPNSSEKESSVLPANINVNSTTAKQSPANTDGNSTVAQKAGGESPSNEVSQNSGTSDVKQNQGSTQETIQNQKTAQGNGGDETDEGGTGDGGTGDGGNGNPTDGSEPIRALW